MTALFYIVLFFFMLLATLLCSVILIQEAKSLGLGASFGGDSGNSLFGTSTAEVLKTFTSYLIGVFLIACFVLSFWTASLGRHQSVSLTPNSEVQSSN